MPATQKRSASVALNRSLHSCLHPVYPCLCFQWVHAQPFGFHRTSIAIVIGELVQDRLCVFGMA